MILIFFSSVTLSESDDSSLNSVDLEAAVYIDSDTGLESMSSAETPNSSKPCSLCLEPPNMETAPSNCIPPSNCPPVVLPAPLSSKFNSTMDVLRQEVTRLKCDKLDLLRQNVVCIDSINLTHKAISLLFGLLTLIIFVNNLILI